MKEEVKIFLVEDNEGDRMLIQETCEKLNPESSFMIATDGEEAIKIIDNFKKGGEGQFPDFVILDLNLPKRNGREILDILKSDEKTKMIPVVVFSSSSGKLDVQAAYQKHANTYVVKPFDLEAFEKTIKTMYDYWTDSARSAYKF